MKKNKIDIGLVLTRSQMKKLNGGAGGINLWQCNYDGQTVIHCYLRNGISPQADCAGYSGCVIIGTCTRSQFCPN
jgi:hypothetical protein